MPAQIVELPDSSDEEGAEIYPCSDCVTGTKYPIHRAVSLGHVECLKKFLDKTESSSLLTDSENNTPLHAAAVSGQASVITYLLENTSIPPRFKNRKGLTSAHVAVRRRRFEALKALLGGSPQKTQRLAVEPDERGCTVLHTAVSLSDNDSAVWLLQRFGNAIANVADNKKVLPIHIACALGNVEFIQIATKFDVTMVNKRDINGATPAFYAVQAGHLNCLKYIVEKSRADITVVTARGHSLLHGACLNGQSLVMQWLLGKMPKSSLFLSTTDGATVFHCAAYSGQLGILRLLYKVSSNKRHLTTSMDKGGNTPLHLAAMNGHLYCAKFLLELGADPRLRNKIDESAVDLAQKRNQPQLISLLASFAHGGRSGRKLKRKAFTYSMMLPLFNHPHTVSSGYSTTPSESGRKRISRMFMPTLNGSARVRSQLNLQSSGYSSGDNLESTLPPLHTSSSRSTMQPWERESMPSQEDTLSKQDWLSKRHSMPEEHPKDPKPPRPPSPPPQIRHKVKQSSGQGQTDSRSCSYVNLAPTGYHKGRQDVVTELRDLLYEDPPEPTASKDRHRRRPDGGEHSLHETLKSSTRRVGSPERRASQTNLSRSDIKKNAVSMDHLNTASEAHVKDPTPMERVRKRVAQKDRHSSAKPSLHDGKERTAQRSGDIVKRYFVDAEAQTEVDELKNDIIIVDDTDKIIYASSTNIPGVYERLPKTKSFRKSMTQLEISKSKRSKSQKSKKSPKSEGHSKPEPKTCSSDTYSHVKRRTPLATKNDMESRHSSKYYSCPANGNDGGVAATIYSIGGKLQDKSDREVKYECIRATEQIDAILDQENSFDISSCSEREDKPLRSHKIKVEGPSPNRSFGKQSNLYASPSTPCILSAQNDDISDRSTTASPLSVDCTNIATHCASLRSSPASTNTNNTRPPTPKVLTSHYLSSLSTSDLTAKTHYQDRGWHDASAGPVQPEEKKVCGNKVTSLLSKMEKKRRSGTASSQITTASNNTTVPRAAPRNLDGRKSKTSVEVKDTTLSPNIQSSNRDPAPPTWDELARTLDSDQSEC